MKDNSNRILYLFKKVCTILYFGIPYIAFLPFIRSGRRDIYHRVHSKFMKQVDEMERFSVLEIGSRNVSGNNRKSLFGKKADYTGFDILNGENVDVVGDAHELSKYFTDKKFDIVYSVSTFEHLIMPWKVVLEINKIMKKDGLLFISTHPTWPPHELPWDFWRFPRNSFLSLLNKVTGFEVLEVEEGLPCRSYSLVTDSATRFIYSTKANLGSVVIAKKVGESDSRLKWDVKVSEITDTMYPKSNS